MSYDKFHQHANNIYRVATKISMQGEVITHEANTYQGISDALKSDYEDIVAATTISKFTSDKNFIWYQDSNGRQLPLQSFQGLQVDSSFFKVFSFELLEGNPEFVLRDPYSAAITRTLSEQYFDGDAIGKSIEIYDGSETRRYKITGVLENVPENSHLKFDLISRGEPRRLNFWNGEIGFWDWTGQTYVWLKDYASPHVLEAKLTELAKVNNSLKRNESDYGQVSTFQLQPLTRIHLFSNLQEELEPNGSATLVYTLITLAIVIIAIAWINYINLSTAISEHKIRSIGLRKVIGASRSSLMFQILVEAALFNLTSVIIAFVAVQLLLPSYSNFSGIPLDYGFLYDKWVLLSAIIFVLISAFLSGIYPAYNLASFKPVIALKGKVQTGSLGLRPILVVFQFGAAVSLIIATVIAYQQLSFMRSADLGIMVDNVIGIKALNFDKEKWSDTNGGYSIDSAYLQKSERFKEDVRTHSGFVNATTLSHLPGNLPNWGTEFKSDFSDHAHRLVAMGVDYDFVATFGVDLLAGRNFSPAFPSDRGNEGMRAVMINESAARLLGFSTPGDAVGKHIATYWGADYEVIGVVNSFHQLSLKENLQPLYFMLQPRALEYFAVRYEGSDATVAISELRSIWQRHFPDYPFNYFFLDDYYDQQYRYDEKLSDIIGLFSVMAVLIACLGLFGLTSYAIVQRTKEIGIRKVLGATAFNVIALFTQNFLKLIIVANVIAVPLVYIGVRRWLEGYAYKIKLEWLLFAAPIPIIVALALITIALQTLKIAYRSPVDSLRSE
jgi:putative ABC transport system permease protein